MPPVIIRGRPRLHGRKMGDSDPLGKSAEVDGGKELCRMGRYH